MRAVKLSGTTVLAFAAIVGAGAFAAGRGTAKAQESAPTTISVAPTATVESESALPLGHPNVGHGHGESTSLPSGHPPIDESAPFAAATPPSSLTWKTPALWQTVPSTSSMRLATLRIPHADGDAEDAEVSITQAGGSIEANAQRWIEQFDAAGQKTAKRSVRKVAGIDVTIVEVEGAYSGGMGRDRRQESGWALVGAIVSTPGMPHFIKLTGPVKTVKAARADFDAMIASLAAS